jgi:hypothetical protein
MRDESTAIAMNAEQLKSDALAVAEALRAAPDGPLPPDLRARFINVRTVLFQRGYYDPILVRLDSATVPRATNKEIGDRLAEVAAGL